MKKLSLKSIDSSSLLSAEEKKKVAGGRNRCPGGGDGIYCMGVLFCPPYPQFDCPHVN